MEEKAQEVIVDYGCWHVKHARPARVEKMRGHSHVSGL